MKTFNTNSKSAPPALCDSEQADPNSKRNLRTANVERAMRIIAWGVLVWSLGGLVYLYLTTSFQPTKFMPLVMRESDSEESRLAAIEDWRKKVFLTNTKPLLGDRPPLVTFNLDAQLSPRQPSDSEIWYWHEANYREDKRTFKKKLFDLNVEAEHFHRDYWARAWQLLESLLAMALAGVVCIVFRRIFSSSLLLIISCLAFFFAYNQRFMGLPSLLWIAPILSASVLMVGLSIYRWSIAPASAEVISDWNNFWLGLLLTCVGLGMFFALVMWGGRVPHKGLAGLGLGIGWGFYLVTVHGWKLLRSVFATPTFLPPFQQESPNVAIRHENH